MNDEDLTMQYDQAIQCQEWILEFDPTLKIAFDDEFDFEKEKELISLEEFK